MQNLPRAARFFPLVLCGLAVAVLARLALVPPPWGDRPFWEFLFLLSIAAFAGGRRVVVFRWRGAAGGVAISAGTAATLLALLMSGPAAAVGVAAAESLAGGLRPERLPWPRIGFRIALAVLKAGVAGSVFLAGNGGDLALRLAGSSGAFGAAALAYFLVEVSGEAVFARLTCGDGAGPAGRREILVSGGVFLVSAAAAGLLRLLLGEHVTAILLLIAPIGVLAHQSYRDRVQRVQDARRASERLADIYLSVIRSLALAVDAKDPYTHQHILRVQRYAIATAEKMGLTGNELEGLRTGALLHDIGKLGVPDHVLLKPGRLTDEEFALIKQHPVIGAAILDPVEFPWPVLPVVKYHHERWDGKGYPEGLKGEDIPRIARVLAVADTYDALTTTRSYRAAWSHEKAVEEIRRSAGSHFDPVVVEAFLSIIDEVATAVHEEFLMPIAQQPLDAAATESAVEGIQKNISNVWALHEVSQTLHAGMDLPQMMRALTRKFEEIRPGVRCTLVLRAEEGILAACSVAGDYQVYPEPRSFRDDSPSRAVMRSRVAFRGAYADDDFLPPGAVAEGDAFQEALVIPLVHVGQAFGTVNLYSTQADVFRAEDQVGLERFVDQAASTLYEALARAPIASPVPRAA